MLPRIIEYLLSDNLLTSQIGQGTDQTVVTIPPLTRIVLNKLPISNDFADIVYQSVFDQLMVPNVFSAEAAFGGKTIQSGLITEGIVNAGLDSFVIISSLKPARVTIENLTNLNQYYSSTIFFLTISSKEVLDLIIDLLRRVSTSERSEELLNAISQSVQK